MRDERELVTERFQMVWPAWLAAQVRQAAQDQAMPVSAWLRAAAVAKLRVLTEEDGRTVTRPGTELL